MTTKRIERLWKLLEGPEGIAIAITGQWGVGKTYFWNEYLKYHRAQHKQQSKQKQEYAYVSVFGIETLGDLKAAIVEQLVGEIPDKENAISGFFKITKRLLNESKNLNLKGLNIGGNLLFSICFSQISNALICIDDLERKSDKLDIKDILGLVNLLKNQRNCKVVVIINDEKDQDQVFKNYKEKVFDEYFIIKDIVEALESLTRNQPDIVIQIFKKFHEVFQLENIRFYKKALRIYSEISNYLPANTHDVTKKQIIQSILVFLIIVDIPDMNINWKDLEIKHSLFSKEKKNEQSKMLSEFYGNYFVLNEWDALLKNLFLQNHNEWSSEDFRRLAESDLISEKQNLIGEKLTKLIDDFYNFNVNNNFGDELYGLAIENINHQSIPNLEFYIRILKMLGLDDRAKLLENKTLENVKLRIMKSPRPVNSIQDLSIFSPIRDKSLVNKIEELIKNTVWSNFTFKDIVDSYIEKGVVKFGAENVIRKSTKEDWRKYIFEDTKEERFAVIRELWNQSILPSKNVELQQWIIELLRENGKKSIGNDVAADHVIKLLTDNGD